MLLADIRGTKLPVQGAGASVDNSHGGDVSKTDQDIAVGHLGNGVAVGPLGAAVLRCDAVFGGVQMLPAFPLPENPAIRGHFQEVIGEDAAVDLCAGDTALYHRNHFLRLLG